MGWITKLFRADTTPAPAVGQQWRSENSGGLMRLEDVRRTDSDTLVVSVAYHYGADRWSIARDFHFFNLAGWRKLLRDERRVLVSGGRALACTCGRCEPVRELEGPQ